MKPKKVDTIEVYNHGTFDIFLHLTGDSHNRKSIFYANVDSEVRLESESIVKLIADMKEWCEAHQKIVFEPVIMVWSGTRMNDSSTNNIEMGNHELTFRYDRNFRGVHPKTKKELWKHWDHVDSIPEWKGANWNDTVEGRPGGSSYKPTISYSVERLKILPYTVERWRALREITRAIKKIDERIYSILDKDELPAFLAHISARGAHLLEAPKKGAKS